MEERPRLRVTLQKRKEIASRTRRAEEVNSRIQQEQRHWKQGHHYRPVNEKIQKALNQKNNKSQD